MTRIREGACLLACDERRLLVRTPTEVLIAWFDTPVAPDEFADALRLDVSALVRRCATDADAAALYSWLEINELLTEDCIEPGTSSSLVPSRVYPLSQAPLLLDERQVDMDEADQRPDAGSDDSNGVLILATRDEALVIRDASRAVLVRGVRMFISRMEDPYRMAVYGALVSGVAGLQVWADQPAAIDLEWLDDQPHPGGATSYSLRHRQMTGSITRPASALTSPLTSRGRLAEGEVIRASPLSDQRQDSWFIASGRTAHPNLRVVDPFDQPESFTSGTTGVAQTEEEAVLKARVEATERFVSGDLHASRLLRSAALELPGTWLDPREIFAYSPRQHADHGGADFDPTAPEWWVRGTRAGQECFLPAALVYAPFPAVPNWLLWSAASSSGVAAHESLDQAARAAWLELVERDAFQRSRLSRGRNGTQRLCSRSLSGAAGEVAETARTLGDLTLLKLPSPTGLPVILGRVDSQAGLSLGMSAATTEVSACAKALTEAVAQAIAPFHHEVTPDEIRSPGDHAALYSSPAWRRRLDWMMELPVRSVDAAIAVAETPAHAAIFEFDNDTDVAVSVARVLDPHLIPLTFGFDTDPMGRPDAQRAARLGGWDGNSAIDPHPFA